MQQVNLDPETFSRDKQSIIKVMCKPANNIINSIRACLCDMAKTNTNQLVQFTLTGREQLFRQLKGLPAEKVQKLHHAPIMWPSEE